MKKEKYSDIEKAQFLQGNGYGFNSAVFSVKEMIVQKNTSLKN